MASIESSTGQARANFSVAETAQVLSCHGVELSIQREIVLLADISSLQLSLRLSMVDLRFVHQPQMGCAAERA